MSYRPIIFSAPMVRALLAGTKTQTRRVVKPQPSYIASSGRWIWPLPKRARFPGCCTEVVNASREWWEYAPPEACSYGKPGDLLWVRETWCHEAWPKWDPPGTFYKANGAADESERLEYGLTWRSPILMPRRFSRITLALTDVRVQRVQDISEEDARAEGALYQDGVADGHGAYGAGFACLWDSINAKRGHGWEASPWVWALSFDVLRENVDDVMGGAP